MKKNKKAQVGGIMNGFYALMFMAVAIVVVIIINAFGADFVSDQQSNFANTSVAYNITASGLNSMDSLANGTGDVTDVGIITIVLALLVSLIGIFGYMGFKQAQ